MDNLPDDIIGVIIRMDRPELGLTCRKYHGFLLVEWYKIIEKYSKFRLQDHYLSIKYRRSLIYHISISCAGGTAYIWKCDHATGYKTLLVVEDNANAIILIPKTGVLSPSSKIRKTIMLDTQDAVKPDACLKIFKSTEKLIDYTLDRKKWNIGNILDVYRQAGD